MDNKELYNYINNYGDFSPVEIFLTQENVVKHKFVFTSEQSDVKLPSDKNKTDKQKIKEEKFYI